MLEISLIELDTVIISIINHSTNVMIISNYYNLLLIINQEFKKFKISVNLIKVIKSNKYFVL